MPCASSLDALTKANNITDPKLFVFSADTNIINSGVMLFRFSDLTLRFIDDIISIGPTPDLGMGYVEQLLISYSLNVFSLH